MKKIAIIAVSRRDYDNFLRDLGVTSNEEREKFTFVGRIDDIQGREFLTVIRAYPHFYNWRHADLFEHAKARIK